jgi:hypothetical protein
MVGGGYTQCWLTLAEADKDPMKLALLAIVDVRLQLGLGVRQLTQLSDGARLRDVS